MNRFLDILCAYNNRLHDEEFISSWLVGAIADGESKEKLLNDLNEARSSEWISNIIFQELFLILGSDQDLTLIKPFTVSKPKALPDVPTLDETEGQLTQTSYEAKQSLSYLDPTEVLLANESQAPAKTQSHFDDDLTHIIPPKVDSSYSTLDIGMVIKNRFVLEEKIGRGGMGTVYRALDLRKEEMHDNNPYVAIKFLNDNLRDSEDALFALQREAKKSQVLAHPNIVTVHDFDRDGDLAFISMEYLAGKTLEQVIADGFYAKTDHQKIMNLIDKIARGLAYAHQEGFVHADLKPSNIFITDDGHIKVLDFGIAQAVRVTTGTSFNDSSKKDFTLFDPSSLGAITPTFASVEMINGESPVPADDVFALGCVAYALLTGNHPYQDKHGKKLTADIAEKQERDVKIIPNLPRRQMQAIRQSLQFRRKDRFENAGQFIDAIKPPIKLRRWVSITLVVLSVTAVLSWWFAVSQTTAVIGLDDLPKNMAQIKYTIEQGDSSLDLGDVDQAHKLYSQAWETFLELNNVDTRDQYKMKVITDRRIDRITDVLLKDASDTSIDQFRLIQLQLALEFLQKGDLGTRDDDIQKSLIEIGKRIKK